MDGGVLVMVKLRIDLNARSLEVEGDEAFVREIYSDFREQILGMLSEMDSAGPGRATAPGAPSSSEPAPRTGKKSAGGNRREQAYAINKDLDLYGKSGKQKLVDFYREKRPSTAIERNTVFVYYLKNILGYSPVTLADVYTCYSALKSEGVRSPGSFKQSIADTSSRKYGYIDAKNMEDLGIPLRGTQFVEHDLPGLESGKAAGA